MEETPFSTVPGLSRSGGPARSSRRMGEGCTIWGEIQKNLHSLVPRLSSCPPELRLRPSAGRWHCCPPQGQGGRFTDGVAWNGSQGWSGVKAPVIWREGVRHRKPPPPILYPPRLWACASKTPFPLGVGCQGPRACSAVLLAPPPPPL